MVSAVITGSLDRTCPLMAFMSMGLTGLRLLLRRLTMCSHIRREARESGVVRRYSAAFVFDLGSCGMDDGSIERLATNVKNLGPDSIGVWMIH